MGSPPGWPVLTKSLAAWQAVPSGEAAHSAGGLDLPPTELRRPPRPHGVLEGEATGKAGSTWVASLGKVGTFPHPQRAPGWPDVPEDGTVLEGVEQAGGRPSLVVPLDVRSLQGSTRGLQAPSSASRESQRRQMISAFVPLSFVSISRGDVIGPFRRRH